MVSAPTVSAARLRSRRIDARASRSSRRTRSANGTPATRASGRQDERHGERHGEQDRVHEERADEGGLPGTTRPDEQADDARRGEHGDEPAQTRAARGRQVEAGLERLDRRDATGPARRLDGGGEGHDETDDEAPRGRRPAVTTGRPERHRADAVRPRPRSRREGRPERRCPAATRRCRSPIAWTRMNEVSWPRVAPAARSSPSSRTRSTTVIDSVLKIRNAPANRATAAMSAVVAAKSPVDARIEAADVARRRQDVGLGQEARPRARP